MEEKKKIQQTLVIIKPDGLKKSLTGNILTALSETRFAIVGAKVIRVSRELAEEHYKHLKNERFFNDVTAYIQGIPYGESYRRVLALVYKGENAIARVRKLAGDTNPEKAESDTIRGRYGRITAAGLFENVIHCSANEEEAEKEIKLWFKPDEIVDDIFPTKIVEEQNIKTRIWA